MFLNVQDLVPLAGETMRDRVVFVKQAIHKRGREQCASLCPDLALALLRGADTPDRQKAEAGSVCLVGVCVCRCLSASPVGRGDAWHPTRVLAFGQLPKKIQ